MKRKSKIVDRFEKERKRTRLSTDLRKKEKEQHYTDKQTHSLKGKITDTK